MSAHPTLRMGALVRLAGDAAAVASRAAKMASVSEVDLAEQAALENDIADLAALIDELEERKLIAQFVGQRARARLHVRNWVNSAALRLKGERS